MTLSSWFWVTHLAWSLGWGPVPLSVTVSVPAPRVHVLPWESKEVQALHEAIPFLQPRSKRRASYFLSRPEAPPLNASQLSAPRRAKCFIGWSPTALLSANRCALWFTCPPFFQHQGLYNLAVNDRPEVINTGFPSHYFQNPASEC